MWLKELIVECKKDKGLRNETIEIAFRVLMFILALILFWTTIISFVLLSFIPEICLWGYIIPMGKFCLFSFIGTLFAFFFAIESDGNPELMWP
jgi:hypothetical protein